MVFHGYVLGPEGPRFVIAQSGQASSGWLPLGGRFAGYVVLAFDSEQKILTLEREGQRRFLPLANGSINSLVKAADDGAHFEVKLDGVLIQSEGELSALDVLRKRLLQDPATPRRLLIQLPKVLGNLNGAQRDRLDQLLSYCRDCKLQRFSILTSESVAPRPPRTDFNSDSVVEIRIR